MTDDADTERGAQAKEVAESLRNQGVAAVALGFVDPSAIVRVKCVPLARFPHAATTGVGLSTLFNAAMSNDHFALHPGYIDGPSGDLRLRADPAATVAMAAMPGWAWAPIDQYTKEGEPFAACPRGFLQRTVRRLDALGLSSGGGVRVRVLGGDGGRRRRIRAGAPGTGVQRHRARREPRVRAGPDRTIEAQGLDLQQFHPEYAEGQFELSIAPRDPVAAADVAILVRETVRAVAKRHGWKVSFAPRVLSDTGNGTHLHISLWDGDRNLLAGGEGPAGMEPRAESFMAGILQELPALVAVTAPSCVSYLRLQPQHWSGAMRCWGTENREAALRFIAGPTPASAGSANMEIKPVDGTANAYLALGAVLAAGIARPGVGRSIAAVDGGGSAPAVGGGAGEREGSGSSPPRCPRRRTSSPDPPCCARPWGTSCSRCSSPPVAGRPSSTRGSTTTG